MPHTMSRGLIIGVIFFGISAYLQSIPLQQFQNQYKAYDVPKILVPEQRSIYSGFSQVFGELNATTNETHITAGPRRKTAASGDGKPPPEDTWLLDSNSFQAEDPDVIQRTINKIYFQKGSGFPPTEGIPDALINAHKSWPEMNPGYTVRYWDLDQSRRYIHKHMHPVFLRAFDCLTAFAAKSDLFRMILLYREGGWHSDWKQISLEKRALQNITELTDFFAAWDMWNSNDFFPHKCVQNAFVGARPRHPNIAKMLEMILINIQTNHYAGTALDATATCIFGRAIHVSEAERNSTVFSKMAGKHVWEEPLGGIFQWNGKPIAVHKCKECGGLAQDWGDTGNNYIQIYKARNYYCQDAASLFLTAEKW